MFRRFAIFPLRLSIHDEARVSPATVQSRALGLERPLRAETWVYLTMIVPFI